MTLQQREKQIAQAEELLGDRLAQASFAKGLYFGTFANRKLLDYPNLAADTATTALADELRRFCQAEIDPVAIDREALIPQRVIDGLGRLGMLGACLPKECGGRGLTQTQYCRLLEVLGGHCASTALFVNAHHSIGPRAIVLFGTPEQKQHFLPKLATGQWISAFALTEPEAGSDAANVQTTATPTEDGRGYVLNGNKRWITNGGIAKVLTVMARTPVPSSSFSSGERTGVRVQDKPESKITAFLVTPDMPGFEVVEARMPKCGVRGSATGRLAFHNMFVSKENILGQLGKGLRVALTVLDFGRVTFGATCTGAAKFCLQRASQHAATRVQFGEPIGTFELVKEKLAYMSAGTFAMEAATYLTAALIDSGEDDYMLETAMLKVFATDTLWRIINDTIQIFGGKAYFTDEPYERMMRDARINMIGEGANDVLRAFVALVGMRDVGLELKGVLDALASPLKHFSKIGGFAGRKLEGLFRSPEVKVHHSELEPDAAQLGHLVAAFGSNVERLLRTYKEEIVERQYQAGRVADAAIELYVSGCVLRRLDTLVWATKTASGTGNGAQRPGERDLIAGRYYLRSAERRIRRALADLWDNDDGLTTQAANAVLP
ncbi:MAG TPA: acyl-CoA dehydrogenase family protein [Pirellulales bacterium]|jgi:alkylation response protein AidB-like acyl-CoA dehydrogenase|nr:acyl-CoA dehydrogenase family protein [Pirellulales bacterium]